MGGIGIGREKPVIVLAAARIEENGSREQAEAGHNEHPANRGENPASLCGSASKVADLVREPGDCRLEFGRLLDVRSVPGGRQVHLLHKFLREAVEERRRVRGEIRITFAHHQEHRHSQCRMAFPCVRIDDERIRGPGDTRRLEAVEVLGEQLLGSWIESLAVGRVEPGLLHEPGAFGAHTSRHLRHPGAGSFAPFRCSSGRAGIDHNEAGNPLRCVERQPQCQRAAERMPAEQYPLVAEVLEQLQQPADGPFWCIENRVFGRI